MQNLVKRCCLNAFRNKEQSVAKDESECFAKFDGRSQRLIKFQNFSY